MTVLADFQIRKLCETDKPMITPFIDKQVKTDDNGMNVISYGLSSYGYDIRLGNKFKIFTNVNNSVINPKEFSEKSFVEHEGDTCIIPPNSFVLAVSAERIRMPANVVGIVLGKSTYARCFSGDTRVALVDGTSPTFVELEQRFNEGERLFGYSNNERGDVVVAELTTPRKLGHEKLLAVTLDNGEVIKATSDHKFMLRDGTYCEAGDLEEGSSLMPLYRIEARGYEAVVHPSTYAVTTTHWLADQWNLRHEVYVGGTDEHRHHIDHNKRNNIPPNIERINAGDHIRHHNAEWMSDPVKREERAQINRDYAARNMNNPEYRQRQSVNGQLGSDLFWKDEHFMTARQNFIEKCIERGKNLTAEQRRDKADKQRAIMMAPERRELSSKRMKELWLDNEFRKACIERVSSLNRRDDITEDDVIEALETAGSIRGAARILKCDRSTFRRFKNIILKFKARWDALRVTDEVVINALETTHSIREAAKLLGVSISFIKRCKVRLKESIAPMVAENHKVVSITELEGTHDIYCLEAREYGNFALEAGVFVKNCGISCLATPLEPGWEGHITLEYANTTPLPAILFAGEGACQVLFFEGETCEISYADRLGKYQNQTAEPIIPKV